MIFGSFVQRCHILGKDRLRLLNRIMKAGISCSEIVESKEEISFITFTRYSHEIELLSRDLSCELKTNDNKAKRRIFRTAFLHSGLAVGLIIAIAVSSVLDDMILSIRIENDSEQNKSDIISVLHENGVGIGSFYSDHDMLKLERELKTKVPGISWAGISVHGSTMVIDTLDNIPIPESVSKRMPCNVVAVTDCVIEKAEVFCGELKVNIGSGVRAGDILISGESEKILFEGNKEKETTVKSYMRADGRIYGTFEKRAEQLFPYEEYENTPTGKTEKVSYLNIFGADIPLFWGDVSGNYTYTAVKKPLTLFGFELPIGITDVNYSEYVQAIHYYTDEDIDKMIDEAESRYIKSFLSDYEIKDVNRDITRDADGVKVAFTYKLYGLVGAQADIYTAKK